jgi:hypothetical protein
MTDCLCFLDKPAKFWIRMGEGVDDHMFTWCDADYVWLQCHFKMALQWVHTNACMDLGVVREYSHTDEKFKQACEGGYDVSKPVIVRAAGVPDKYGHDLAESKKWFEANHTRICGDASIAGSTCPAKPILAVNDGAHRIFLFNEHTNLEHRGRVFALVLWNKPEFWTPGIVEWYAITCNEKSTTNNAVTDFEKMWFVLKCGDKGYTNVKTTRLITAWKNSKGNSLKLLFLYVCVSLGDYCLFVLTYLLNTRLRQSSAMRHQNMERVGSNPSLPWHIGG